MQATLDGTLCGLADQCKARTHYQFRAIYRQPSKRLLFGEAFLRFGDG